MELGLLYPVPFTFLVYSKDAELENLRLLNYFGRCEENPGVISQSKADQSLASQ